MTLWTAVLVASIVCVALKALGYPIVRVRHYGELGRVEIAADDLPRALAGRAEV